MTRVGAVTLEHPVALAPMAGMTDTAFRRLVKRHGGCGLVVSEMVSSEGLVRGIDRTLEYAEYTEEERPVSIQIFGGDPKVMADAAQIVEDMGADIIDINMGCPVPKIAKHNAGCSLMREPEHAATVVRAMVDAVKIPVTVKMRAGWNEREINAPTLARYLKLSGYATGHFGKWHMGGQRDVDDAPPITAYGFDQSLTNFEGMGAKLLPLTLKPGDEKPGRIWQDAERLGKPFTWMLRSKLTTGFIDAAIPFMDKAAREGKPFYVNLWPDDVHSPFWQTVEKWAEGKRGLYLAVLEELDRQLGKLFDHVRSTPGLRDNTLILVCSDNGHEPGAGSAGPFKGAKATLFEGGVRSPLVVWGPGLIGAGKAGHHNDTAVFAAFDLVPSLLRLAKAKAPERVAFDGEDVLDTVLGRSDGSRRAPLFWRRPPDRKVSPYGLPPQPDLAVREANWKLLCEYDGSQPQLYDLAKDHGETTNRAAEQPEVVRRLTASVVAWHRSMPPDNGPAIGLQPGAGKKKKSN